MEKSKIKLIYRGELSNHMNVIFQGFTGSGKTYLSCALAKEACKLEIRTRYIRLPDLLIERDDASFKEQGVAKHLKNIQTMDF